MILLKKRGTDDVHSPLNLGGRSNTYARKKGGSIKLGNTIKKVCSKVFECV